MSHGTGISVLIRTSNSEKPLRALLSRLRITSRDEIILVDTGSKDGTVALAEEAGARVIQNEGPFNYSSTLNLGFQAARNGQVLALSVHCLPVNSDFLELYRQTLARLPDAWGVVYGTQVFSRKQYEKSDKTFEVFTGNEVLIRLARGGNANALYSKQAWAMHRFDESLKTGEDLEWRNWAARTGLACALDEEACVFYRHSGGPIYRFKKGCDEVWILGDGCQRTTVWQLTIGIAHSSRHLLWEEFLPRAWIGQVSHILGCFAASRGLLRPNH